MQHQKAKHFKCGMCPRRLNTAGGLAVHIQQVHKLEPENLPRIENALPGRDGYEVEIFGMEGIPAPDVADYKRRKEIELGLAAGSISQPPPKRPKTENRPLTEEELRQQLEQHKRLMGASSGEGQIESSEPSTAVIGAPAQTYISPPVPSPMPPVPMMGQPAFPFVPPGVSPPPPGAFPGQPPFPPVMPPGPPPPGFPMPPPPGMIPPPGGFPPGVPPFQPPFMPPVPGMTPPFPPPVPGGPTPPPPARAPVAPPPTFVPASSVSPASAVPAAQPILPNPALRQTLPEFKKPTDLKYKDPNFSPDEMRSYHSKYAFADKGNKPSEIEGESRGKKRARAEDFL